MKEIKAIIKPHRLEEVLTLLHQHPQLPGLTISHVEGFGHQIGRGGGETAEAIHYGMANLIKIECVVDESLTEEVVEVILKAAKTGGPGDGKIFISTVDEVIAIRDGSRFS